MTRDELTVLECQWAIDARKDALDWQEAKGSLTKGSETAQAYEGGFANGWRQAVATLRLHGLLD